MVTPLPRCPGHPSLPEAPTTPAPAPDNSADKLDPALLRRIGEVTADSVLMLADGMREYSADGAMAARTRVRSGELLLQLYTLQQSMMTNGFARLMHEHGKAVLWQRNPEIFRCHPGLKLTRQYSTGDLMC